MFKKILIANRGEIAVRIIRACKELGILTVAVYSVADEESLHVKLADEALCIGPASPQKSYLNIPAIVSAAEVSGAEAIHPGYGFLSESSDFSQICKSNNITFIGASPENIRLMGNKAQARKTVHKLKVPTVPGSEGIIKNKSELMSVFETVGCPVIIKASSGGGGRGMRVVEDVSQLDVQYDIASNEAQVAFGNGDMYLEKFIQEPRHVEIQILSDRKGNVVCLGERDCSIQRRHQKLIEESPSVCLTPRTRKRMFESAIKIAKGIKYQGAGTVEFLVDKDLNYYFMEMNTRIQVEHPVTEMVTNVDLVKEQIRVAFTKKVSLVQKDIRFEGHAIEFRINAEDPDKGFAPCPGKISLFLPPGGAGVRVDSFVYPEYVVSPHYDSLIAKLIIWGKDREEAICRSRRALEEFIVDGVATTIPFHLSVLENDLFIKGKVDTHFVDSLYSEMAV